MTSALTRRAVLRGGLVATVGTVAISAVASCDRGPSPEQITAAALVPLADAALADQAAARALAPRMPEYANALGVVAGQRGEHARALREEITRLDEETAGRISGPAGTSSSSPSGSSTPSGTGTSTPTTEPTVSTVAGLREQLRQSARAAADATGKQSGYPAGLAGSISASVISMVEVQLA